MKLSSQIKRETFSMHLEWLATVRETGSILELPRVGRLYDQPRTSDVLSDLWFLPRSLAASLDVVELQNKHIVQRWQSTWAITDQGVVLQGAMQGLSHLRDSLYISFEAEPLEDGIDHPAEDIIGDAIRSTNNARVLDWLFGACLDAEHPTFSASILRCLGRQVRPGTGSWRTELIQKALSINDVEIRDAALQAAELWGGMSIRETLKIKVQTEPVRWLQNYMRDVIEDLN